MDRALRAAPSSSISVRSARVARRPRMKLRGVSFERWLQSHPGKEPKERWLRELYPWPVLAQVDCDDTLLDQPQKVAHDGVDYTATLLRAQWQPDKGTFRYRVR